MAAALAVVFCAGAAAQRINFNKVSRAVVDTRLEKEATDNAGRLANLKQLFVEAGCKSENLVDQQVDGSELPNVICTLPGTEDGVVVVGAHYDARNPDRAVVDNWSGVALLPSLYEGINKTPRKHSFVFVGFAANENGKKGSKGYVQSLTEQQRKNVKVMVNLDSLGMSGTKVWLKDSNKELTVLLAGVGQATKLEVTGSNVPQMGEGDAESFNKAKIPNATVHSVTSDNYRIRRSKKDNLDAINRDDYYDSYSLLTAYLAYLDIKLD